jgi:hypothetical protein
MGNQTDQTEAEHRIEVEYQGEHAWLLLVMIPLRRSPDDYHVTYSDFSNCDAPGRVRCSRNRLGARGPRRCRSGRPADPGTTPQRLPTTSVR